MKKANTPQSIQEKAYLTFGEEYCPANSAQAPRSRKFPLRVSWGTAADRCGKPIRRLTAEGLLRPSPTGGSVVVDFSRRDVAELYELREALEVYAVGKAAEHKLSATELETLTVLGERRPGAAR